MTHYPDYQDLETSMAMQQYSHLFNKTETGKISPENLKQRQELPLHVKIYYTLLAIDNFYLQNNGKVYIAYSGGKDSEVLRDLVLGLYPTTKCVFVDTGMELETREHAIARSTDVIKPKKKSYDIWHKYGLPFPSKQQANYLYKLQNSNSDYLKTRLMTGIMKDGTKTMFKLSNKWKPLLASGFKFSDKCCYYLKKEPFHRFNKQSGLAPYIATMAEEGFERKKVYMKNGCINLKNNQCTPLGFWTEQDILLYLKTYTIDYCKSAYGDIIINNSKYETTKAKRTGCFNCLYGVHLEPRPNRLERMKITNPHMWQSLIKGQKIGELLDQLDIPYGKTKND
jgi:3'-phosphoadenosine 5'-phosphosulfate sulfotransferase (PAPS reductase)/FAD synthetase